MWLTSDLHLGHERIIELSKRPFQSVDEMNETLISNWNKVVGKKDVIWHLGDFAYGPKEKVVEYAERLNGKIHVLIGNHDNHNHLVKAFGETRVFSTREIRYNKNKIFLHHYAQRVWPSSHHGSYHAYGHSHGGLDRVYDRWGRSMDVGVDNINGYRPISVEEFLRKLEGQPFSLHHPT